ncbi:hydrophobic protein LTI6A-like [Carex rostrata]
MCTDNTARCLEILLALVLPPLGVFFRKGLCSLEFWICLLLTILGYVPGMIYAVWIIVKVNPDGESRDIYEPLA